MSVLTYALKLNTSAFTGPMAAASGALRGFTGAAGAAAGTLAKLAAPVAALGAGFSAWKILSKAADFEELSTSMEVLTGSAKEARDLLAALKADSNKTPFEFGDYAEAGKILIALGGNTSDVRGELTALGNIAAGLKIPLGEMATAYGKARNDGVLYMETLNQFNDKGIPVIAMLAQRLNLSTVEVKKLASEGGIGFGQLQQVLSDLTSEGGKFFGLMDKQAGTTKGLLSSLKSALDSLMVTLGTPINDFLKPILDDNLVRMQVLNQKVVAFLKLLGAAREQGKLGDFIGASLKLGTIEAVNTLSGGIRSSVAYLGAALPEIFSAAADLLTSPGLVSFMQNLFRGVGLTIRSELEYGAAAILRAFGETDLSSALEQASRTSAEWAGLKFEKAGSGLGNADFAGALDKIGKALTDAHAAGVEAARAATAKPLIDPKMARDQWKELAGSLDPKALEDILKNEVEGAAGQVKSLKDSLAKMSTAAKDAAKPANQPGGAFPVAQMGQPEAAGEAERKRFRNAEQTGLARQARLLQKQATRPGYFSNAEKIELENLQRKFGSIGLAEAAAKMGRGAAAADPNRGRRGAAGDAARPDPLLKLVQGIHDRFANLATA